MEADKVKVYVYRCPWPGCGQRFVKKRGGGKPPVMVVCPRCGGGLKRFSYESVKDDKRENNEVP